MNVYLVAEEAEDVELLNRTLPAARLPNVYVVRGGISTLSLTAARTLHATREQPVILLLDAKTVDEESIDERQAETGWFLRSVGSPLVRAELVFAVPELEVVLFHDPEVLERLLGIEIPESARIEARFIPKKVLAQLLEQSGRFAGELELVEALDDAAAQRLAQHPLIQQLEALIADVRAQPVPEQYRLRPTG
jgi:hypothetical protein